MTDPERKRLLYQAMHRGFKEADILLGGFAKEHLATMSDQHMTEFGALMEMPDHDIYAWIIGRIDVPANFNGEIMARLKAFSPLKD